MDVHCDNKIHAWHVQGLILVKNSMLQKQKEGQTTRVHGLVEISLPLLSRSLDAIQTSEVREEPSHISFRWTKRWR
jgi:hypothetical protein